MRVTRGIGNDAHEVVRKALELNAKDRAEVAARLLDSLEQVEGETDAAWVVEIERRAAEMESGAVQGVTWEEECLTIILKALAHFGEARTDLQLSCKLDEK